MAVIALFAGVMPPGRAADPLVISLEPTGATVVPLGRALSFKATFKNPSQEAAAADVIFEVRRASGSEPVAFERFIQTVPAGETVVHRTAVTVSQWFRRPGEYVLTAGGQEQEPVDFSVTRSPIRVPRFKNVTSTTGVETMLPDYSCGRWSAGAAWADIEGDGDVDLFVPRREMPFHMWINNQDAFTDEGIDRGLEGSGSQALGAVFADYDNDGDPDLYVTSDGPNLLYRNDGSGHFEEIGAVAGVADDRPGQSASFGDYNNDGLLDLYVSNHGRCGQVNEGPYYSNKLYRNEGDGTFSDQTSLLPVPSNWDHDGASFQGSWFDYDDDGDLDLFLANDFWGRDPRPNVLWRNDGGAGFTDVSVASNTSMAMNSMGVGISDFDRDMDLDFAVSNIRAPALMVNDGDGGFSNRASEAGIARDNQVATSIAVTWGTIFSDLNNDGWEDLYFSAGRLGSKIVQPNELFTNARDGSFLDHSAPSKTDDLGVSRGVALADYDRDGRIDIFVVNQRGTPNLYRNVTGTRRAHWLAVDTVGRVSNRDGCGAKLKLKVRGATLLRQVFCGSVSLGSSSDPTVHFGLGARRWVRKLVIEWPSGERSVKRGFRADRLIKVREPK